MLQLGTFFDRDIPGTFQKRKAHLPRVEHLRQRAGLCSMKLASINECSRMKEGSGVTAACCSPAPEEKRRGGSEDPIVPFLWAPFLQLQFAHKQSRSQYPESRGDGARWRVRGRRDKRLRSHLQ